MGQNSFVNMICRVKNRTCYIKLKAKLIIKYEKENMGTLVRGRIKITS